MYDTLQALSGNFNLEDVPKSIKFKIDFKKNQSGKARYYRISRGASACC